MTARAFLALGSNLGDRAESLGRARRNLTFREAIRLASCSAVIETEPVDVLDQPDFLNQVVGVDTALAPRRLLAACLEVERELGRERAGSIPRGPRVIDIDILLYDGRAVAEKCLAIPHPRLGRRSFLLALCREAGAPETWLPVPENA